MSPIMVGGDDSVKWVVDGDNVRETESKLFVPERGRPRRFRHTGVDETETGEFTVLIKLPKASADRKAFIRALTGEAKRLSSGDNEGATLTLRVPIEDRKRIAGESGTADQITVQWKSATETKYLASPRAASPAKPAENTSQRVLRRGRSK